MPVIRLLTEIRAPIERCFDLSRSVSLHVASTMTTGERAVGGVTHGLLGLGDTVTWRARHFGIRQELTARITGYDRPRWFRDSQVRGAFARFNHDHYFESDELSGHTVVTDLFDFHAPWGWMGRAAESLFLVRYMERFLRTRNAVIQRVAEGEGWKDFLPAS